MTEILGYTGAERTETLVPVSDRAGDILILSALSQSWIGDRLHQLGKQAPSEVFRGHSCDLGTVCKTLEGIVGVRGVARVLKHAISIAPEISNGQSVEVADDLTSTLSDYEELISREKSKRARERYSAKIIQFPVLANSSQYR